MRSPVTADPDARSLVDVPELLRRREATVDRWARAFGSDVLHAARVLAALRGGDYRDVLVDLGLVRAAILAAVDELAAGDPRSPLARDVDDAVDVAPGSRDRAARAVAAWLGVPVAHDLTYRR